MARKTCPKYSILSSIYWKLQSEHYRLLIQAASLLLHVTCENSASTLFFVSGNKVLLITTFRILAHESYFENVKLCKKKKYNYPLLAYTFIYSIKPFGIFHYNYRRCYRISQKVFSLIKSGNLVNCSHHLKSHGVEEKNPQEPKNLT